MKQNEPRSRSRELPARTIPVPDTVSDRMQALIGGPLSPFGAATPRTADELKALANAQAADALRALPALYDTMRVRVEPLALHSVNAFMVTPEAIAPENARRLLVHLHGGCFVLNGGAAGTREAALMAGFGRIRVLSVDYRMAPDHPYPAALDDAVAAWTAAQQMASPANMAIFGTSAGGNLTMAAVLRARRDGLPLPAAIGVGTPMSDLTGAGDSFHTNAMLDNVLVGPGGGCDQCAALYLDGHDPRDPMVSPVYGDLQGFPPAILTTGTRDLLLSSTVRVHRKLRQAGVEASLQVFEGQSHAHYLRDASAPETREAFEEIARFFDRHLGR